MAKAAKPKGPIYSVTALMAYERCPLQYHTTFVRGIPPPITRGMRRGTSIHSAINKHLRGKPVPDDLEPEVQSMLADFKRSRFAVEPVATEKPFILPFQEGNVRGRIDLILPRPDGGLELVDFKSGTPQSREDLQGHLQLPLYAIAAGHRFDRPPEDLAYTYYFLRDNIEVSFPTNEETLERITDRVNGIIQSIQEERFDPAPGCTCYACEWDRRRRGSRRTARVELPGE